MNLSINNSINNQPNFQARIKMNKANLKAITKKSIIPTTMLATAGASIGAGALDSYARVNEAQLYNGAIVPTGGSALSVGGSYMSNYASKQYAGIKPKLDVSTPEAKVLLASGAASLVSGLDYDLAESTIKSLSDNPWDIEKGDILDGQAESLLSGPASIMSAPSVNFENNTSNKKNDTNIPS